MGSGRDDVGVVERRRNDTGGDEAWSRDFITHGQWLSLKAKHVTHLKFVQT